MIRNLLVAAVALPLCACAASPYKVHVDLPANNAASSVSVKDGRLDKTIYMTAISSPLTWGGGTHTYLIVLEPSLESTLTSLVGSRTNKTAMVAVERLELRTLVGFAKPHELSCEIESNVNGGRVRTGAHLTTDESNQVPEWGRMILDNCLTRHADEISSSL